MIATTLPSPGVLAAAALGALVVIGALTVLMRRNPEAFPLLAVIALPFRLPISADGRTVNLLLPLYAVVAAGVLAHLLPRVLPRGGGSGGEGKATERAGGSADSHGVTVRSGRPPMARPGFAYRSGRPPMALDWLLGAAVILYALQAGYSSDVSKAAQNLAFFYVPFGLLYVLMREAPWTPRLVGRCFVAAVSLAVVFAGVGFVEYGRKALFLNPKVVASDEFGNYFRVNSLFFDPSIYGRFLALVMIAVTTAVLWARTRRVQWIGAAVLVWLLAGLVTSFSQSSVVALLLGLAVLAAWRWDVRATVYLSLALVAIVGVVVLTAPASLHFGINGSGGSASNATSGRTKLISGGLKLWADRPLQGYGSGSFEKEYRRTHTAGTAAGANATSASHTIPITVAAEQGIVGFALYVALLVVAFLTLFSGAGRSPPRIAIAACFAALVLHTWVYADFLEDPITWTLLGMGVAFAWMRASAVGGTDVAPSTAGASTPAVGSPG